MHFPPPNLGNVPPPATPAAKTRTIQTSGMTQAQVLSAHNAARAAGHGVKGRAGSYTIVYKPTRQSIVRRTPGAIKTLPGRSIATPPRPAPRMSTGVTMPIHFDPTLPFFDEARRSFLSREQLRMMKEGQKSSDLEVNNVDTDAPHLETEAAETNALDRAANAAASGTGTQSKPATTQGKNFIPIAALAALMYLL